MNSVFPGPPRFPLLDLGKVVEKIIKIGKSVWNIITGKDEKQDELAKQKSLNPEKSQANEIAELNKLLSEYRQKISDAGNKIEGEMIIECTIEMQEIMDFFDKYNKELKIARTESVKRKFKHLNSEIKGTFADYIDRKISLDNPECVKVLKLPAGDLKKQRLQEMKQNVFLAAKDEVIEKIQYTVSDFTDSVEDAFLDHLDRAESAIEEKREAFEKMSSAAEGNNDEIEDVLLHTNYLISLCTLAESL